MAEEQAKSAIVAGLVRLADAWCAATGGSRAALSRELFNRGGQIDDLAAGARDLNTRSAEDALKWFAANWPAGADWPEGLDRPPMAEAAQ